MAILDQLKYVAATKPVKVSATDRRRSKFISKLNEQIGLAKASANGQGYVSTRQIRRKDEAGNAAYVNVSRPVKAWWWRDEKGQLLLGVRYGSQFIELVKGKIAIAVGSDEELVDILSALKDATMAGEMDNTLQAVSHRTASRFGK